MKKFLQNFDVGLLVAAALALFAAQALLKPGLPTTADLIIHIYRALEFEHSWAAGVIFPRWAPNLAFGYGYPLWIFAPPLPYLLALLFDAAGLTLEGAFKALLILTMQLYAVGMYLLARDLLRSVAAGLVAAVAFAFAPFALREALLYGGNVPQYLAIAFFPWTLWAAYRALAGGGWGWTALTGLFYAAIILSHLFHALIFSAVFGVWLLLLVYKLRITNYELRIMQYPLGTNYAMPVGYVLRFFKASIPVLLGMALSAFFWLPAFIERNLTRAQTDIILEKSPFFIRYPYLPELLAWIEPLDARAANPYVPLSLGVVTLILTGLGLLAAMVMLGRKVAESQSRKVATKAPPLNPETIPSPQWGEAGRGAASTKSENPNNLSNQIDLLSLRPPAIFFFAGVALASALMTLPVSRPVWEIVSILQVAEFPWRLLGLANLGLAFCAGAAVLLIPARWRGPAAGVVIAGQLLTIAPLLYPTVPFTRFGNPTIADQIQYERSSQSVGTTTLGEYLPISVTTPPTTSPLVDDFRAGQFPERLDRASLPPDASANLLEQTAIRHQYALDIPEPFTLRLHHFDFPGWQANLNGQPLAIYPEPDSGLMLLDIPAGQHTLTVHFTDTPLQRAANAVSGLTIVVILAGGIFIATRKQSPRSAAPASRPSLNNRRIGLGLAIGLSLLALLVAPRLRPLFTIESPPARALPAQYTADVRFNNGIQLIGYDLTERIVEPGGYTQVTLYWQTDAAPYRVNLQPFVHLDRLDDFTTIADATNYTPGDVTTEQNMPTFHWDNSRYVRDEHNMIIPPDAPPQAYAVRVGLIDPDQAGKLIPLDGGAGDTAWIDTINIASAESPPPLTQSPNVEFTSQGDSISLLGFELADSEQQSAGSKLANRPTSQPTNSTNSINFNLLWQAAQTPQVDYTIFSQLLDANGQLIASFDRPPLDGAYPTSTWLAGQSILDPRFIPLDEVPPGDYRLIVGLYNPATGQRLTTPQGADFVELSTITVD